MFLKLVGLPLSELDTFLEMKDGILRPSGDDLDEIQASQKVVGPADRGVFRRGGEGSPEAPA